MVDKFKNTGKEAVGIRKTEENRAVLAPLRLSIRIQNDKMRTKHSTLLGNNIGMLKLVICPVK
jgi:hypothetical protein